MKSTSDFEKFLFNQHVDYENHEAGYNSVRSYIFRMTYEEYVNMNETDRQAVLNHEFNNSRLKLTDDEHYREVFRHLKGSAIIYTRKVSHNGRST